MIFVPLPLFASLLLIIIAFRFFTARDMSHRAHQLFLALIVFYALQSFLVTLRWGYQIESVTRFTALLAPVLPVLAYLSYGALTSKSTSRLYGPLVVIPINWFAFAAFPDVADVLIVLTYLGFGVALIWQARLGPDALTRPPFDSAQTLIKAMLLTGLTLILSAMVDIYVVIDFIRNGGENVSLIVTVAQTIFVMIIGCTAAFGRASTSAKNTRPAPSQTDLDDTSGDAEIIEQLNALFDKDGLHKDEEINLRKLARRLHVPDRRVSNAVNRACQQSVSQFVNERRVKDACILLSQSNDSVLNISLASGFATKSNFNREFRRVTGRSPSEWREENGR